MKSGSAAAFHVTSTLLSEPMVAVVGVGAGGTFSRTAWPRHSVRRSPVAVVTVTRDCTSYSPFGIARP
jgi:hypothetical protein